jgi:hypothetical protein
MVTDRFSQPQLVAPSDYSKVHAAIVERLGPDRAPFLIGIDGRDHSGKSSLGAWLSWQLNMPCIHLDPYAKAEFEGWHTDHLRHAVNSRLDRNWPVLAEGCLLLRALAAIDRKPDFLVFVENGSHAGSALLHEQIEAYFAERKPKDIADYMLHVQFK